MAAIDFIKKNAIHLEAISIIILLSSIWFLYFTSVNIQEEISLNCGWGEEDYRCYCEKSESMEIENKLREMNGSWDPSDITITINDTGEKDVWLAG